MADLSLHGVTKQFGDSNRPKNRVTAVNDVQLDVADGEFLVLVGPSGCGKSTTLRMIAGLESIDSGEIRIAGRVVNQIAPKDRDIAMVFQNYALYPHLTVYKNLSFGLELRFGGGLITRGIRRIIRPAKAAELSRLRRDIPHRVQQAAERLNIDHLLNRKPHELSGGERQRVALGRAIVRNPAAFLFDEPLSNLDAQLRGGMRVELKRLHQELKATMIYVTHDQVEAMTLGDRIAVMNGGRIVQLGKPMEVYRKPNNRFVARFIGSVPMNLVSGKLKTNGDQLTFCTDGFEWFLPDSLSMQTVNDGDQVELGIRAEHIEICEAGPDQQRKGIGEQVTGQAMIAAIEHRGDSSIIHLDVVNTDASQSNPMPINPTPTDQLNLIARHRTGNDLREGQRVAFRFDPEGVHWFDSQSGDNLMKEDK